VQNDPRDRNAYNEHLEANGYGSRHATITNTNKSATQKPVNTEDTIGNDIFT